MTKAKRVVMTGGTLLLGGWAATQIAAYRMADSLPTEAALGGEFGRVGGVSLYAPWSVLAWSFRGVEHPAVRQSVAGLALSGLAVVVVTALLTRRPASRIKPFGEASWGTRRDMKRAGLLDDAGTVLGVFRVRGRGQLLTYDGPEHQLVSGASRAGKGVGHVIPTLLCWPGSALVYDVKGELWEATAGYRSKYQHCLFFNPTRLDGARFNPMLEVRKGRNEVRDAQNLVEILINPDGAKRTLDVWDQNASQFLTALVLHVLYAEPPEKKHLGRVRELLLDFNNTCRAMATTPHRLNTEDGEPEVYPEVARVAQALLGQSDRFRSSVRGTAEGYLTLWADEVVCQATSRSDFTIGDLVCLDRPVTLYLQPPPSDAGRVRPLVRLILNQIARGLMEDRERDGRGRPKRHRLLMLLDEFPTLGRLPFFSDNLRQMAGYGLKAHLVVQSFNDIVEAYGPHNTIIDNCHVLCCFASPDTTTQQRISQMTGEAVEYRESYSHPRPRKWAWSGGGSGSVTESEQVRTLLQPGEVRTLPYDEQLVFVTGFKPFRTKKLRYYEHPDLRERVVAPPSPSDARLPATGNAASAEWMLEGPKGDPLPPPQGLSGADDNAPHDEPPPSERQLRRDRGQDLEDAPGPGGYL